MNALKKELAYGAAYNVFYNANRQDRNGLNESQIKLLNWLEPSMANAYAFAMVETRGNQKKSLAFIHKFYAVENLKIIFEALNNGKSEEEIVGLINI